MIVIRLLPVCISFLLIAAHFQRAGLTMLALASLFAPCLLFIRQAWAVRTLQILMALAALEWVRTLIALVQLRMEADMPWIRLAIIIGGVALFTACSILVFRNHTIQQKYTLE